jgi:hypothetical protein
MVAAAVDIVGPGGAGTPRGLAPKSKPSMRDGFSQSGVWPCWEERLIERWLFGALTEGSRMAITIDRVQRDAIYNQIRTDLSGLDDINTLLDAGDIEAALRHRRWFEDDMRLLDDLGWEPDPAGERFELTMPPADLIRLVRRLNQDAATLLKDSADERDDTQQQLTARTAYGDVLAQLADEATTAARGLGQDRPSCRHDETDDSTGGQR